MVWIYQNIDNKEVQKYKHFQTVYYAKERVLQNKYSKYITLKNQSLWLCLSEFRSVPALFLPTYLILRGKEYENK
jgi:hypothetical protein